MNLFAKPVVTWKQPEAFRVSEDHRHALNYKWWLRPLCLSAFIGMVTFGWELAKITPGKHPPDFVIAFPGIVGFGLILFYLYPWWLRRCPASVTLYSSGIIKMGEQSIRSLKTLSGYNWSEEGSYYVLSLITKKGRTVLYGIPDQMILEKIEIVLKQAALTKISPLVKPDFAVRRKAIWGERVFTTAEVETMREEENK